jgi:hypothetical protein
MDPDDKKRLDALGRSHANSERKPHSDAADFDILV